MVQQNIYDNPIFFDEYKRIRDNHSNANILIEKPALFSLLPDMNEKKVLDLGCGFGENCVEFINRGAKQVLGIDISEKMLNIAIKENYNEKIDFKKIPMEEIANLNETYDIIVSSLAVHYIQDFPKLVNNIYALLNTNGYFIFSQENPINTCFSYGNRWTKDNNGNVLHANISNYSIDGLRNSKWFVDDVVKYHRTFSSIINTLVESSFIIEKILEPIPTKEIMDEYSEYKKDIHKPDFMLVKVKKQIKKDGLTKVST